MNILKEYPAIEGILNGVAQQMGHPVFQRSMLGDLQFCDRLLAAIHAEPAVPGNVRLAVYTTLMSPGTGGLQAFAWLIRKRHVSAELLKNYLHCLPQGAPAAEALDEKAGVIVGETILDSPHVSEALRLPYAARLLNCTAFSAKARVALFRTLQDEAAFRTWATEDPGAPEEVFRVGLQARVGAGEDPQHLASSLLFRSEPEVVANGLLDLLEFWPSEFDRDIRSAVLSATREHADAKVRRRAYQLAELTEGESFLRLGLRDLDSGVRNWVLARVTRQRRVG